MLDRFQDALEARGFDIQPRMDTYTHALSIIPIHKGATSYWFDCVAREDLGRVAPGMLCAGVPIGGQEVVVSRAYFKVGPSKCAPLKAVSLPCATLELFHTPWLTSLCHT